MELRLLRYFLAVAKEQSITGAAKVLHISQPALSRQLKDLEDEFGKTLLIRGSRKVTLTPDGEILRRRAEEMMRLAERTRCELTCACGSVSGDIHITAGETCSVHFLTRAAQRMREDHPNVRFHIMTGDSLSVTSDVDSGLTDFGLLFDPIDMTKYNTIRLPVCDRWGVLVRRDDPLAQRESISVKELAGLPLLISRHASESGYLKRYFCLDPDDLNLVGTYSLIHNASLMVEDGIGCALCIDGIVNTTGESKLCFVPIDKKIRIGLQIVWKRDEPLTRAAQVYLKMLCDLVHEAEA